MSEDARFYVNLDEKELRSIITRRAQAVALASRENAHPDKLYNLHRECLIAVLNLTDLVKRKPEPELVGSILRVPTTGELINDEIPL